MASKKVTLKGGQLVDTDSPIEGFVADDESGLYFVPDAVDTGEAQRAYASVTHRATETNNPLWNQITFKGDFDVTASSLFEGHVTLQGLKDDGTLIDIADKVYTSTYAGIFNGVFDLLTSSCTGDVISRSPGYGSGASGTVTVEIPKMYQKYEDVDIMPSWYDSSWAYRMAHHIEKSGGMLHGKQGHSDEYYGITAYIPYSANMNNDFSDIRFTGTDGITECPYYTLDKTDGTSAVFLVMIPWYFMDLVNESTAVSGTYVHSDPSYIYCYYGNATATTASDVTLGGNGFFGDDFEDDAFDSKWTVSQPANTTVTETGGYAELKVAGGATATCSIGADMDDRLTSHSGSFEIIWKMTYKTPLTGTVANDGPYLRISGRNPSLGGVDESNSYWNIRLFYTAANTAITGVNAAGHLWQWGYTDSGASGAWQIAHKAGTTVAQTRYIKMRRNKRNGIGSDNVAWYGSLDGYRWDFIGNTTSSGTVFDTITRLNVIMYYVGASGVAADKYVRFDSVIAYPIMSGEYEIPWTANWGNASYEERYYPINAAAGRTFNPATNSMLLTGVSTSCVWDSATKNAMLLYMSGSSNASPKAEETLCYETTISAFAESGAAGSTQEAGICLIDNSNLAVADADLFGIRFVTTGAIRTFYRQGFTGGTSAYATDLGGVWTQADLPITLRIRLDHKHRNLYYDYKKENGEWSQAGNSVGAYNHFITSGMNAPAIYSRNATANSTNIRFSALRAYTLGGVQDCIGLLGTPGINEDITWLDEEVYADYPLAYSVTPDDNDTTIIYTNPTPMKRNNPMILRTKEFGGDYSNSKILYVTDDDYITIGPEGGDKYIGMRLVFDFSMAAADEFNVDEIDFIYEVI